MDREEISVELSELAKRLNETSSKRFWQSEVMNSDPLKIAECLDKHLIRAKTQNLIAAYRLVQRCRFDIQSERAHLLWQAIVSILGQVTVHEPDGPILFTIPHLPNLPFHGFVNDSVYIADRVDALLEAMSYWVLEPTLEQGWFFVHPHYQIARSLVYTYLCDTVKPLIQLIKRKTGQSSGQVLSSIIEQQNSAPVSVAQLKALFLPRRPRSRDASPRRPRSHDASPRRVKQE